MNLTTKKIDSSYLDYHDINFILLTSRLIHLNYSPTNYLKFHREKNFSYLCRSYHLTNPLSQFTIMIMINLMQIIHVVTQIDLNLNRGNQMVSSIFWSCRWGWEWRVQFSHYLTITAVTAKIAVVAAVMAEFVVVVAIVMLSPMFMS